MATKYQVISRVALKAMVHVVPEPVDKSKVRSRGPNPVHKFIDGFNVSCSVEDWEKRWAAAVDVLKNGVKKVSAPKAAAPAAPVPPAPKPEAKTVPTPKKPAAKTVASKK